MSRGAQDLPQDALCLGEQFYKAGWVPTLLPQQALTTSTGCSTYRSTGCPSTCRVRARGEDAAVLHLSQTGRWRAAARWHVPRNRRRKRARAIQPGSLRLSVTECSWRHPASLRS